MTIMTCLTLLKNLELIIEVVMIDDLISRQAAIDGFYEMTSDIDHLCTVGDYISVLESLSAQQEIIRCNACRHWHQTTGKMKGFGLGDCDYLEKKLVTCNGYCYWAERRTDG